MELTSHPAGTTGPTEVLEIGRFAVLADASDAPFGVFRAPSRS